MRSRGPHGSHRASRRRPRAGRPHARTRAGSGARRTSIRTAACRRSTWRARRRSGRTQRLRPRPHDGASGGSSSLHFLRPPVHQYLGIRGRDTERPEVAHMLSRIVDAAADRAELVARRLPQEGHGRDDDDRDQGHHQGILHGRRAPLFQGTGTHVVPPDVNARVHTKEHLSPLFPPFTRHLHRYSSKYRSRRSLDPSDLLPEGPSGRRPGPLCTYVLSTALPTVLNLLLAALPRKATAAMITPAISATISAYSTAVAPFSSRARTLRSLHQTVTPV